MVTKTRGYGVLHSVPREDTEEDSGGLGTPAGGVSRASSPSPGWQELGGSAEGQASTPGRCGADLRLELFKQKISRNQRFDLAHLSFYR